MITCKEDLHNTWIKNDRGELRDLYISLAKSFGIDDETCDDGLSFIGIFSEWGGCGFVGNTSELLFDQESRKQLTIKDLKKEKPTPTKFVKVEDSIFDLKEEFERGELYMWLFDEYLVVPNETQLSILLYHKQCYRQVEIDWRDILRDGDDFSVHDGMVASEGLVEEDKFIAMCHAIAELTEKPEGV